MHCGKLLAGTVSVGVALTLSGCLGSGSPGSAAAEDGAGQGEAKVVDTTPSAAAEDGADLVEAKVFDTTFIPPALGCDALEYAAQGSSLIAPSSWDHYGGEVSSFICQGTQPQPPARIWLRLALVDRGDDPTIRSPESFAAAFTDRKMEFREAAGWSYARIVAAAAPDGLVPAHVGFVMVATNHTLECLYMDDAHSSESQDAQLEYLGGRYDDVEAVCGKAVDALPNEYGR